MPGRTTSDRNRFHYVYVLESVRDGNRYIGLTSDLRRRFLQHQSGYSSSTAPRRPFKLVYYEACTEYDDAERREHYLKTTGGRRFLAKRLRVHMKGRNPKLY